MPKLLAVLLIFLSCFCVAYAESNPQWVQVQTEHFTVITDSNDRQARQIAVQFERMRSLFHQLFPGLGSDAGAPITVLALKDRKGFTALEPAAYLAKGSLQLAGLFLRTPDKNYILIRLDAEEEHPYSIVYHEYIHYLMRKAEWVPLWLNEGLAEFYQNTEIDGKNVRLGQPSPDDILYLRNHKLLPLSTLLAVDYASPYYHEEQKGSVFYAQAWALTHFMVLTDYENKTTHMKDYARFLQQHEDPVTAAQHAFGDLSKLQKALDDYISQLNFKLFTMKLATDVDEASFKSTPISLDDVNAIRADVLVGNDRSDEAKGLLDKVLADDPRDTLADESEGRLCMRKQDYACARKWFTEAVKLDSKSYMANYYYAVMSMQAGVRDSDDAIEASLLAAIKLQPSFAPAYDALGGFYDMRNEKLDQAHMLYVVAIQLEPEEVSYRLNASNIEMQRSSPENAIRILEAAAAVARKPSDVAMVQARIAQVKSFLAQQEKFKSGYTASDNGDAIPSGDVKTSGTSVVTTDGKTFTVASAPEETVAKKYPVAAASAKHHTITGTLHEVKCSYPTTLTLKLDDSGKSVSLFTADYYKVPFGAANFKPPDPLNPCEAIEGLKARIEYADVTDPDVAGQIVSIILSK